MASRMTAIRKRFARSLLEALDRHFYEAGEADSKNPVYFKPSDMVGIGDKRYDMRKCLESAYDVRSRYVHSGEAFGTWVSVTGRFGLHDHVSGRPGLRDKRFAKVLEMCPMFCGLERIVRYALLRRMGLTPDVVAAGGYG